MNMVDLNTQQAEVVAFVKQGHNTLITGQAGVGKSEVVRYIIRNALSARKSVALVCSSGISCTVYKRGRASTVHSWYGLQDANMPWRKVVERAANNSLVRERVKSVDVIIWDEASMSSQRIFEIVNVLHHELTVDELNKHRPFAGKQIILVGEFLQLKPVPNIYVRRGQLYVSFSSFYFCYPSPLRIDANYASI